MSCVGNVAVCRLTGRTEARRVKSKTNSMRLLESRGIAYQVHEFSSEVHSAEGVAEILGIPASHVYKTLVVMRQGGRPLLVMVPGDASLDLKRLARSAGEKKLRMATQKEAAELTGLQVGGISALALQHKRFDVYADEDILTLPRVYVSAGCRGIDLSLSPQELLQITGARCARLAEYE
jgi:Cys-tRNA(Pro)/Cys-tRNA(Cys) deacylase